MKKFLSLVLFFLLAFNVQADIGPVGRSFWQNLDGTAVSGSIEKWYIYVKNTSGGTVNDGTLFVHETTEDDGYSVTTSVTQGAVPVCVLANEDASSCSDDEVCRCQTYGRNDGVLFSTTGGGNQGGSSVAGQLAYQSVSNAGYVQRIASGSATDVDRPIGMFYDALTTSQDAQIFLRLR